MATYSSIFAWRIPWTEEPGWLQSMGVTNSWIQLTNFSKNSDYLVQSQLLQLRAEEYKTQVYKKITETRLELHLDYNCHAFQLYHTLSVCLETYRNMHIDYFCYQFAPCQVHGLWHIQMSSVISVYSNLATCS